MGTDATKCVVCKQFYSFDATDKCVTFGINNCVTVHVESAGTYTCDLCEAGYAPNPAKTSCVQMSTGTVIKLPNCYIYEYITPTPTAPKCLNCDPTFVQVNGQCVQLQTPPSNCLKYTTAGACVQCDSGYYINANDLCVLIGTFKPITGCLSYGKSTPEPLVCMYCDISGANPYVSSSPAATCALMVDSNCLHLASTFDCSVCKPGYILDSTTKKCKTASQSFSGCAV